LGLGWGVAVVVAAVGAGVLAGGAAEEAVVLVFIL
jgi:hypothetical protein